MIVLNKAEARMYKHFLSLGNTVSIRNVELDATMGNVDSARIVRKLRELGLLSLIKRGGGLGPGRRGAGVASIYKVHRKKYSVKVPKLSLESPYAQAILELINKNALPDRGISFKLTQEQIGAAVGLHQAEVSAIIIKLRKAGLVDVANISDGETRGRVSVYDQSKTVEVIYQGRRAMITGKNLKVTFPPMES